MKKLIGKVVCIFKAHDWRVTKWYYPQGFVTQKNVCGRCGHSEYV